MKRLILFLSLLSAVFGHHILCIQNVPSRSHHTLMMGIVRPLLEAGHQVTMITTFPEEKPAKNLRYIDVGHLRDLVPKDSNLLKSRAGQSMSFVKMFARNISRSTIETPAVREALIKQNFDAVVTEWFFSDSDAGYAAVQQAPWILLSGMVIHAHLENIVDTVRSVPTIPTLMNDFPVPMSFWQRLLNTGSYLLMAGANLLDQSKMEANYVSDFSAISSARGVPLPPYNDALYNVSVLLVNSHPSFAPARSLPPNVVDIASYHMDENIAPLPKDLQDLLDSSTKGVVYFSMGSVLKSADLPEKTKKGLIKVFSELPYTVLWKFEEKIEGLPKNVHVRPWMPQSSILSHPNVLVFITHGGLLSTLESLYHGIPIIAIPVFGDQPGNAKRCVQEGRALMVSIGENMAEDLNNALKDMLGNDSYYKKAKELSKLFRSRPVKPYKLIQHYVELAIESKGAYHLRSKTHLYKWYELWMLDQIAFVLAVLAIAFSLLKKVAGLFMTKQKQKGKKEKKN
ncbi:UDP-glucosyltransferase 2-like isoform X2 [Danaus plexippus]|nr:UDP-glucosyltransferase 2-like isoform X2 [Danaus plexippus]